MLRQWAVQDYYYASSGSDLLCNKETSQSCLETEGIWILIIIITATREAENGLVLAWLNWIMRSGGKCPSSFMLTSAEWNLQNVNIQFRISALQWKQTVTWPKTWTVLLPACFRVILLTSSGRISLLTLFREYHPLVDCDQVYLEKIHMPENDPTFGGVL